MTLAGEVGLDLVEISPNATPPVCKIMDFGKYKYEQQKRESEAKKKQKVIEVKEVKFRPNTDEHDYTVKMKNVTRFLDNGDKVKVTLRCWNGWPRTSRTWARSRTCPRWKAARWS
jgi:translation initiation factor IF-3